jgi:RNA polymerase sigma-70 factor (ECF subfamily)
MNQALLLERVQAGQSSALEELYDAYAAPLHQYALTLLWSRQDAEDAVQNVFVKLVGMIRGGRSRIEDLKNYLYRAVRNEALTLRTRRQMGRDVERRRVERDGPILEAAPGVDPLTAAQIEEALARLPVDQRETIVLKVYQGFTFAEIAELAGEKLNTVASRYKYAIAKLQNWVRDR